MTINHDNENFFQEIDEEVRLERLHTFWKTYYKHIIIGFSTALLMGIGVSYWFHRHQTHRENLSETFSQALDTLHKGTPQEKKEACATLESLKKEKGYGTLARLIEASHWAQDPSTHAKAIEIYDDIATSRFYDKKIAPLARLVKVYNILDTQDPESLKQDLTLLKDPQNPWQVLGMEMDALLENRLDHPQEAEKILKELSEDARASQALRSRAFALLTQINAK